MTTLSVGQNKQFKTIAAAVAASRDGDVVAVDAGTYVNDFATINTKITVAAVGGTAHLVATVAPPNGKAIFVTNTDITLDRLEFSGTQVPDGNGAGIRYQGGHLVITNSSFHDNQDGLLAADAPSGSITIRNTEFSHNGTGDGRTHNLYVGHVGTLLIENSSFHDAVVGHQIKSRADTTIIRDSHVYDGAAGTGSYSIDLPNGGRAVLTGNLIEQGAASGNPVIVAFGEEGNVHANSSLEMSGNTVLNDLASPSARLVWNATGAVAELAGNKVFGLSTAQYSSGPVHVADMVVLATKAAATAPGLAVAPATPAGEVLAAVGEQLADTPAAVAQAVEVALPPAVAEVVPAAPATPDSVVTVPAVQPVAVIEAAAAQGETGPPALPTPVLAAEAEAPTGAVMLPVAEAPVVAVASPVVNTAAPTPIEAPTTATTVAEASFSFDPNGPEWEQAFHDAIAAPPASRPSDDAGRDEMFVDPNFAGPDQFGSGGAEQDVLATFDVHDAWNPNLAMVLGGHGDFHYS